MNCIDIGFDQMLAMLHQLHGRDFIRCLQLITERHEFTPIPNNPNIYAVGGEDYFVIEEKGTQKVNCR